MIKTREDIWMHLDELNWSKVFIMFSVKYKKKLKIIDIEIQSVMGITKCGKSNVDLEDEVRKEKHFLTEPIYQEYANCNCKVDGMLTWNNDSKKVFLSGKTTKKLIEQFKKEIWIYIHKGAYDEIFNFGFGYFFRL